jgi:hypothetical protein
MEPDGMLKGWKKKMRTNIAIASASTTIMRVSAQLDLDVLVPMLIQGLLCAAERH